MVHLFGVWKDIPWCEQTAVYASDLPLMGTLLLPGLLSRVGCVEHFHTYFLVPTCNIPTLGRELRGGILLGHRVSKCLPSMDIARLSEVGV